MSHQHNIPAQLVAAGSKLPRRHKGMNDVRPVFGADILVWNGEIHLRLTPIPIYTRELAIVSRLPHPFETFTRPAHSFIAIYVVPMHEDKMPTVFLLAFLVWTICRL